MTKIGFLDRGRVQKYKSKLVAEGSITDQEIEKAKKARKPIKDKERIKNSNGPYDERIFKLMELGFGLSHISDILELNLNYVRRRRDALKLKKGISQKKIDKARKNRENMASSRRADISQMLDLEKSLKKSTVQNHIEYAKGKFHLEELEDQDVDLISRSITTFPEFITMGNVNLIVTYLTRNQRGREAVRFINECIFETENKDVKGRLQKARESVETNIKLIEAKALLKEGVLLIEDISARTGLSTIDVIKLKKKIEGNNSQDIDKKKSEGHGEDGQK